MNKLLLFFFLLLNLSSFSQQVVDEIIPIDTSSITYQVIYKETVGDYFQLKKAVFANDTSVIAIEKNYSNGVQNGLTRVYYPSGKLRVKSIYGNNKLQGEWTLYGEDGIIITKGIYNRGIKDGYWAYKSLKTYGRYKEGVKHRNWVKKDINNQKHKAWFWNGKFKKGSSIFHENYKTHADSVFIASPIDSNSIDTTQATSIAVDAKIVAVFKYIAQNYYFRKASKDYFRATKKERAKFIDNYVNLDKDVFKFTIAPATFPININYFNTKEKLLRPTIDSLLNINGSIIESELLSQPTETTTGFERYITDANSKIALFISKPNNNIVALEIIETNEIVSKDSLNEQFKQSALTKMKLLFLLNEKNEIVEVEYQLPNHP